MNRIRHSIKYLPTALQFAQLRTNSVAFSTVNIFDSKAKAIQKNRTLQFQEPDLYDYLKDDLADQIVDRICDIKREFSVAVDYGCGKGHIGKQLNSDLITTLHQCDTAKHLLSAIPPHPSVKTHNVLLESELFPFEENSLDLVVSSLSLHWINDLPGVFSQIKRSLKDDGCFLGVMFGGDTLYQLRCALQLAEMEREGGFSAHISPFTTNQDLGGLLTRAGFNLITIDVDEQVIHYPTMMELMYDLKGMGENNCAWNRKLRLNRDTIFAASAIYKEMYGVTMESTKEEAIPATFQFLYFIGWKPDPKQQKPLPRGSGEVSLKDIGKLDEIMEKSDKKPK